jgi:hypothetical protein
MASAHKKQLKMTSKIIQIIKIVSLPPDTI